MKTKAIDCKRMEFYNLCETKFCNIIKVQLQPLNLNNLVSFSMLCNDHDCIDAMCKINYQEEQLRLYILNSQDSRHNRAHDCHF